MTTERLKSIGILTATLIVGALLGLLVPALYHKVGRHHEEGKEGKEGKRGREHDRKGDWLVATINKIVKPDSAQIKKITPVTAAAAAQLDAIEQNANLKATQILDSLKVKLHPLINDDQWQRLEKFDQKAKEKWNKHGREH